METHPNYHVKNAYMLNDVTKSEFYCKVFVSNIIAEVIHDCYTKISAQPLSFVFFWGVVVVVCFVFFLIRIFSM